MNELVSVVLPVRNGERTIRQAIESVLNQTYPHFELIVVDNSDDSTPEIVKSYHDKRLKYFRQKSKGSVNGYNEALDEYVSGEFVTFIHHDDIYRPSKLYDQIRMFDKFSDVDVVYHDIDFVDNDLKLIRFRGHEDFYHRNQDLLAGMMIGYGISNVGMCIMVRRDFIERQHLRYSLETIYGCDHTYVFDLIDAGAVFKHVKKSLLLYRIHEDNYSLDRDAVERDFQKCYSRYSIDRLKEIVQSTNFSDNEKEVILGKLYYRLHHIDLAEEYFLKVLANHDNPWAAFYLGTGFYRYRGDFTKAEQWLKKGSQAMPYCPEFLNNIGCCIIQTRGIAEAENYFSKALKLRSDFNDADYNLRHCKQGAKFNPRLTAREIEHSDLFGVIWKNAEKKREESGSLQPAGNL